MHGYDQARFSEMFMSSILFAMVQAVQHGTERFRLKSVAFSGCQEH